MPRGRQAEEAYRKTYSGRRGIVSLPAVGIHRSRADRAGPLRQIGLPYPPPPAS
jgi:hypothetical protein